MKIKTDFVPDNAKTYLTVGKEYDLETLAEDKNKDCGWFIDDEGDRLFTMIVSANHLDNRDWEVCDA